MADIYINYGIHPAAMTTELMQQANIRDRLDPSMHVVIKPNLVVARPAAEGATTHPEIVEGIVRYLLDCGIRRITIAEGSWVGDSTTRAWQACGYTALAQRYGVSLVDTKSDAVVKKNIRGMELHLCRSILQADFLINVPVLKGHCQTTMTACLKNLKGCIPDKEKRRYHTMGLHKPIATLAAAIQPDLHIVDSICGDLNFEEGGNPIESNRILLGFDPVLLDSYGAALLGHDPAEIPYLELAAAYGVGRLYAEAATEVLELHAHKKPPATLPRSAVAKQLSRHILEDGACSACYAALIFALEKTGAPPEKIRIGQGFQGKTLPGLGVGTCTSGCACHLKGCPPKAVDIVDFLAASGRGQTRA